jgi:hypothetical protein
MCTRSCYDTLPQRVTNWNEKIQKKRDPHLLKFYQDTFRYTHANNFTLTLNMMLLVVVMLRPHYTAALADRCHCERERHCCY